MQRSKNPLSWVVMQDRLDAQTEIPRDQPLSLLDLPPEVILGNVLPFLTPEQLIPVGFVNYQLRALVVDNSLYKQLFAKYFPEDMDEMDSSLRKLREEAKSTEDPAKKEEIEKHLANFWRIAFYEQYKADLMKTLSPTLKELLHQILCNDLRGVQDSLANKSVWKEMEKKYLGSEFPLLFTFIKEARQLNHQAILNCFYINRAHNNIYEDWVFAILCRQPLETILLEIGNNLNVRDKHGFTPLHYGILMQDTALIKHLLDSQVEVSAKVNRSFIRSFIDSFNTYSPVHISSFQTPYSPLHLAVFSGDVDTAKTLLEKKADVNASALNNITPLDLAIQNENADMADLLLAQDNIQVSDRHLRAAVEKNCLSIVRNLLKNHIKADAANFINDTLLGENLLHIACRNGKTVIRTWSKSSNSLRR